MPRPTNKADLMSVGQQTFDKLWQFIEGMSDDHLNTDFNFTDEPGKKEAHWLRDKNLRDILIHLHEWHKLLLNWIKSNSTGQPADFLPAPYTWKTYGQMNVEFWTKHQQTELSQAEDMLKASHREVIAVVESFTNDELFTKKYYDWTGSTSIGVYCVSSLSSHYDWALKKLRAHVRKLNKK